MATEIGAIRARMELDISNFQRKQQEAKAGTKELGDEAKKTADKFRGIESALLAVGASSALVGFVRVVKSLADEANKLSMSMQGLVEVTKAVGGNISETTKAAEQLAARGFMTIQESAEALKTTLSTGYGLKESIDLINALADAAAYNRASHLGWGEAVLQAVRGIKMQNSELTDAAGITTNLSVMYDRYAKAIGTSADKLTEAGKAQAAYSGMMQEAALFAGNADTAMQGYTGTQAEFNKTITVARQELGEAFLPAIQQTMDQLIPVLKGFAGWASENKGLVAGLGTVTIGLTALLAVITAAVPLINALRVAAIGLSATLGPIGLLIAGLSLVVGGFAVYKSAADAASEATNKFARSQELLNAKLAQSPVKLTGEDYKTMTANIEQLNEVLERRKALQDELDSRTEAAHSGQGSIENTHRIFELADAIKAVDKELKSMDYGSVEEAEASLRGMQDASKGALGAIVQLQRQSMQETIAHAENVKEMKKLNEEYTKINGNAKLTEQQKARLAEIVRKLKAEYPDLVAQLDEENRWHIKNIDSLKQYITGEESRVKAAGKASIDSLNIAKVEAEERVRIAKESLAKIEALEKGPQPDAPDWVPSWLQDVNAINRKSVLDSTKDRLNATINDGQFNINEATKLINDISTDNYGSITGAKDTPLYEPGKEKTSKSKGKTKQEMENDAYQDSLKIIQYKRDINRMSEQEELAALNKLKDQYKGNADIRMDVEVRIYQLQKQIAEEKKKLEEKSATEAFRHSQDWIEQEERRMTLAGKSEKEIAQMKFDAWTRVRNRFAKDSEFYKQADDEVYRNRIDKMHQTEQAIKGTTTTALRAIERQKQAELDALDEQRRAIQRFYDDKTEVIDDAARADERKKLIEEIEKYRYATSEQGRAKLKELQVNLRKMDDEDQKRSLQKQKEAELDELDSRKRNIESWYDDLGRAFEDFSGDMIPLFKLLEDERFAAFEKTNERIKAELTNLQAEYAKVGGGTPSSSVIAQMQANSAAWSSASASERKRLEAENQRLGTSIGATYKSSDGRWYKSDGTPLYHSGGIAGVANFQSGSRLLPDELSAILRVGESILTPQQIRSLAGAGDAGKSVTNNYYGPLVEHSGDVRLEDGTDIRTYHREQSDIARQLLARGERE